MDFVVVRPRLEDAEVVYIFRSDPEVLKNSLTFTKNTSFEVFYPRFLATHFTIKALPPLFILMEGEKVGLIRFDRASGIQAVEISIVLRPDSRGKGLAKKAIKEVVDWVRDQGFSVVIAKIKHFNIASINVFEQAGFKKIGEDEGCLLYIHPLAPPESRSVFVIAEAGSNWTAADPFIMIKKAKEAGADAIKFQVFRAETTYVKTAGKSGYLKEEITSLFKSLEMPYEMIPKLAQACYEAGIEFMATPFSVEDFKAIDPYVKRHKIASYENNHLPLLKAAAASKKPLIVSTGASKLKEVRWTVEVLKALGVQDLTLMQCTAKYPAPPEEINLETIPALKETFKCAVGLSDHSLDPFSAPLGAVALGATVLEKHFTLDRNLDGPDHGFAIEPHELKAIVKEIRLLEAMRGYAFKEVTPAEKELRAFARRGIQAIAPIREGEAFQEGVNIAILRPGNQMRGAPPEQMDALKGKIALRNYNVGEGVFGD